MQKTKKNFLFQNGQKVVFIGDSITDCGRRDTFYPCGNGYVKVAIDLITARYPERNITYLNEGIGGNTVEDLFNRWYDDVIIHKPDWVSIKIGINDVDGFVSNNPARYIPKERFEELYIKMLKKTQKETSTKLILIDPFFISNDRNNSNYRSKILKILPEYIKIIHKLAEQFNAISIHTHEIFQNHLKYKHPDFFCPEPVHPYISGHTIIALELLNKLNW